MLINFSAGPGFLEPSVKQRLSDYLLDKENSFLFHPPHVLENEALWKKACHQLRQFDAIPDDFVILLMPVSVRGVYELLSEQILLGKTLGLYQSGYWSYEIWQALGSRHFVKMLSPFLKEDSKDLDYVFSVSNETISGFKCPVYPQKPSKHIVDKTSDFLASPTNWATIDCALIGCQKVFSFPGATLVIARKDFLETLLKKKSAHNLFYQYEKDSKGSTRSNLHVWLMKEVTEYLQQKGWPFLQERRKIWLQSLYKIIDTHPSLKNSCPSHFRSDVQVTFSCQRKFQKELEMFFQENQCCGYKAHQRFGPGYRLSLYPLFVASQSLNFLQKFSEFSCPQMKGSELASLMLD